MTGLYQKILMNLADGLEGFYTPFQERYAHDPLGFTKNVLGVDLWSGQEQLLQSVKDNTNTAVSAAPSTGKTFGAACVALWLLNCFPHCKIIVTAAPPERQIKDLLFGEIRLLQKDCLRRGVSVVGGEPKTMELVVDEGWWIKGFTQPSSGSREERISKFHGHHGRGGTFAIVDEAHGVPPEIMEAIDNCLTGEQTRLLLLFNPLAPSGVDYNATRDPAFNTITISAFDHPNVVTGQNLYPGMVGRTVTETRINKWTRSITPADVGSDQLIFEVPWTGESRVVVNPIFCYKVLGQFPWEAEAALVPLSWIQRAKTTYKILVSQARMEGFAIPADLPEPVAGLDVAEMGQDTNTFAVRYGSFLAPVERWQGLEIPGTIDKACRLSRKFGIHNVNVDAIGVGAGVAPGMRDQGVNGAKGVKVSWSPTRETEEFQFVSLRDQLWWAVREWFSNKDAAIPEDEELEADLLVFEYEIGRRGIGVTPKKKVRRLLLGRSPDAGEALMLTFYTGGVRGRGDGVKTTTLSRGSRRGRR